MKRRKAGEVILSLVIVGLLTALAATQARAVPSFARQTGQDCYRCHTMFPELTPTGRVFKMTGYVINKTMSKYPSSSSACGDGSNLLCAHQCFASLQEPCRRISGLFTPCLQGTISVGSPQQLSVFYAGQIYDKFGAFIQATYANDANNMAMDTVDVRYANNITLCDNDLVFGATLNNNPTVEDVWNSTPAFSFPYATSNFAPTPAAATLIDNTLAAQVGGAGSLRLLEQLDLCSGNGLSHRGKRHNISFWRREPSAGRAGGRRPSLLADRLTRQVWCSFLRTRNLRTGGRHICWGRHEEDQTDHFTDFASRRAISIPSRPAFLFCAKYLDS